VLRAMTFRRTDRRSRGQSPDFVLELQLLALEVMDFQVISTGTALDRLNLGSKGAMLFAEFLNMRNQTHRRSPLL